MLTLQQEKALAKQCEINLLKGLFRQDNEIMDKMYDSMAFITEHRKEVKCRCGNPVDLSGLVDAAGFYEMDVCLDCFMKAKHMTDPRQALALAKNFNSSKKPSKHTEAELAEAQDTITAIRAHFDSLEELEPIQEAFAETVEPESVEEECFEPEPLIDISLIEERITATEARSNRIMQRFKWDPEGERQAVARLVEKWQKEYEDLLIKG